MEDYTDHLYMVLRMFSIINGDVQGSADMVLRNNMLLTFRETDFGVFKKLVGDKLVNNTGNLRKKGEDYLLYMLLDVIIDQYFLVIEGVKEKIEDLEHEIFPQPPRLTDWCICSN